MLIKTDPDIIQSYFEDASGLLGGHADGVCIPDGEKDVQSFLADASQRKKPVTVSGGGTGVTGGRIPFGGFVLSLENLNKILDIKKLSDTEACAIVQPGVTIRDLKAAAQSQGWMYPPDPTEQTAWIGGTVSTNASGSRGLKYGPTRKYVRRLRAVLSNGEALDIRRGEITASPDGRLAVPTIPGGLTLPCYRLPDIKNAAGYYNRPGMDLIDLFIGHEGTLGAITEIEVSLIPLAEKTFGGVAFFPDRVNAWDFVAQVKNTPALDALALEYFDRNALELLRPDYPAIPKDADAAIFFEQALHPGHDESGVLDEWSRLLESHKAKLEEVWFAMTSKDRESFREFRHHLPEKVNEIVRKHKFPKTGTDIAVPDAHFRSMLKTYEELLEASGIRHLVFGHIGENHMHANLLPATESEFVKSKQVYLELVDRALRFGGTVSAEHGIGKLKHPFIEKMLGEKGLREMSRVKKTLDPALILGRGNLIPEKYL